MDLLSFRCRAEIDLSHQLHFGNGHSVGGLDAPAGDVVRVVAETGGETGKAVSQHMA